MRIVVTGAPAFIGSHLSEALVAGGHDVVGIDAFVDYYPRPIKEANVAGLAEAPAFTLHELDLRTDELAPVIAGADAVVHLAAMAGLLRSWTEFRSYMDCNVLGTQRLLEATRAANVERFVHVSTSSVYGRDAVGDEDQPLRPISPYGVTKLAAENLVLAFVDAFGLNATVLRYFSIFGPRQRPDMGYHLFIEALLDGRTITIFGDGEQTRTNTFVSDAVAATVAAITRGERGAIYNVGGGEAISVNEAIAVLADHLGVEPSVVHGPERPGDQRHTAPDTSRARRALGYAPSVGAADGLRRQADWQRARRG